MQVFQNLANNIQFSASRAVNYRTAVVYANLTDEEALQIGRSHNEMTGTNLPPKFRDDVTLARNLLLASGIALTRCKMLHITSVSRRPSSRCLE